MKIELFHLTPFGAEQQQAVHVATLERVVGTVESCLDRVYRCTQNVHSNWVESRGQFGLEIEPTEYVISEGGCRSTSVGDYCLVHIVGEVRRFECAAIGWKPVPAKEAP